MLEIGPGEGILTEALLPLCRTLDCVEIDRDLVARLKQRFGTRAGFRLHSADALRFDFRSLASSEGKLRVVGNLPYNISTPLLFRLFEQVGLFKDLHFMLQKEVVNRLTAEPGTSDYGRLGIMAGYHCRAEKLFEVLPGSFFPRPKVVSAVVRLVPHEARPVDADPEVLRRVVATAFSQRRKTLRNSLGTLFEETELSGLGIDPSARAENLDLAQYARLAGHLTEKTLRACE